MPDSNDQNSAAPQSLDELRQSLPVRTTEPPPSDDDPWKDDLLSRHTLAENLTNFIRPQREPLVIGLHGDWGSGKTFFLQRWIRTLKQDCFPTFYYNAWEDDYAPAPLIPILTSIGAVVKTDTSRVLADKVLKAAIPLVVKAPLHFLKAQTGIDLTDINPKLLTAEDDAFTAYRNQKKHRDDLRKALTALAAYISNDFKRPTVCVIDELDRCRPTFTIELLETMKHIFNVPGLVFLLALNRSELARSIQSVYGQIHADTYLRRFFHVHLDLPTADTTPYSLDLLSRFQLDTFFQRLSAISGSETHNKDYQTIVEFLPLFWRRLGLSLRDIHHCVTSLVLVCRNLNPRHFLYPALLAALIVVRLRDLDLYHRFLAGTAPTGKVLDTLHSWVEDPDPSDRHSASDLSRGLEYLEASFYAAQHLLDFRRDEDAITQLKRITEDTTPEYPNLLSTSTLNGGVERAKRILGFVPSHFTHGHQHSPSNRNGLKHLLRMIDLVSEPNGNTS